MTMYLPSLVILRKLVFGNSTSAVPIDHSSGDGTVVSK